MTLKDIALLLNLSKSTVSRALNDHPKISQKTKDDVLKIAKEYNFTINTHARSLATNKSNRIGVIFPENFFEFNKRDFFSQLEKYILSNAKKIDYDVSLIRTNSLNKIIKSRFVDGVIIANRDISQSDLQLLIDNDIPHVFVAYLPSYLRNSNEVVFKSDNIKCGYDVAKYLTEKSCKKILTITSTDKTLIDYCDRTIGFLKFMNENLFEKYVYECDMTFDAGKDLVNNNLDYLNSFDGIYCQQDKVALGIISLSEKYQIDIPKKLKIIGHDDLELIDYFSPKLTTVEQNYDEITFNSLEALIAKIEDKEKSISMLSESKIIERETT